MELTFNLTVNGQTGQIKCNDMVFDYAAYRNYFPEQLCLALINEIKKQSGKKMAIVWGNCQTLLLQKFLLNNYEFARNYFQVILPAVCSYIDNKRYIEYFQENFWSMCDLFISQRVAGKNRFNPLLATQNIPARLPEDTKIIWIPNVYFDGYFPQYVKNLRNVGLNINQSGLFPMGDKYVDKFLTTSRGGGG